MSTFRTTIAVDVAGVKRLLPQDSFVEKVVWDDKRQAVDVIWSNRNCVTPYSVPTDFTLQMLHDQQLPKAATLRETKVVATETPRHGEEKENTPENIVTDTVKVVDGKRRKGKVGA